MNYEPKVVISILNWMNYEDTINCIEGLNNLSYKNFEIIVRDNNSLNNSFSILKSRFPELKIFSSKENLGYAFGHLENFKVVSQNKFDLFWILNSDIQIFSETLTNLVEAYKIHGDHIYGSVSLNHKNIELVDFGGAPLTIESSNTLSYNNWKNKPYKDLFNAYGNVVEVESVEGSSMLLAKNNVDKYGFLKTDFFMYAEETDYCYSMRKKGVKSLLVTNSLIVHENFGSSKKYQELSKIVSYYRRRNSLRFNSENFGLAKFKILTQNDSILILFKSILKGFFKKKDISYYYALGTLHAFLNIKGKVISPEKYIK